MRGIERKNNWIKKKEWKKQHQPTNNNDEVHEIFWGLHINNKKILIYNYNRSRDSSRHVQYNTENCNVYKILNKHSQAGMYVCMFRLSVNAGMNE